MTVSVARCGHQQSKGLDGWRRKDGSLGTVCIYQASSPEAIREHARLAELPVDEIVGVADTVIVRPDP